MTLRDYQEEQLFILIRAAKKTKFGQKHQFTGLQRYEDFRKAIPISFYDQIEPKIRELKDGAADIFWPGKVNKFAISAGTSGDGKHLPLTDKRLHSDKLFMRKVAKNYILQRPNILNLWGKHISLPGILEQKRDFQIGEISAHSAQHSPWWLSPFQLFSTDEMIQLSFQKKIERVINKAEKNDVRVITAAPSWLLTIFQEILKQTGANSIAEIWPNLSLLICGGVKLANYRPHLQALIQQPVDFIETYGASEGYFSFTDNLKQDDMKLVIDNGIFYEFVPNPLPDRDSMAIQEAVPIWEVKADTPYAMLVSTNAGLWRYPLNDIVQFTKTNPPRIKVMGRVNEMLDEYGEALYAYEADQALQEAAKALNIEVGTFTIGATLKDQASLPRHYWFIHVPEAIHRDTLNRLAQKIDTLLRDKNRHYAIRRESEALDKPKVQSISQQKINGWLKNKGKQGAQGKLPSILRNDEDIHFLSDNGS